MDAYFAKTKREKEEREVEEKAAKYAAEVKANREKSAAERNEKIPVGPAEEPAKGAELDLGHSFRDIQVWEKSINSPQSRGSSGCTDEAGHWARSGATRFRARSSGLSARTSQHAIHLDNIERKKP